MRYPNPGPALLKALGRLLAAIVVGCLLMTCVYALPTGRMLTQVSRSIESIEDEGGSFTWAPGYPGTRLDGYTDNIMMQTAVYQGSQGPLKEAMLNHRMNYPTANLSPGDSLINYVYGARNGEVVSYGRYWHGYLLFLKPLLLFFSLSDIRMFDMLLQWVLAAALLLLAYKRGGRRLVIPLGLGILALNPVSTALSMQYSSIYLLTLVGCLAQLGWRLYEKKDGWLLYLWLGIATAFFDFLTYPPVAPCLCLILALVLAEESLQEKCLRTLGAGLSWGLGYGGMWGGKWLAGSLLTGQSILSDAMENVRYRAGSQVNASEGVSLRYGQMVLKNLGAYLNPAMAVLAAVLLGLVLYLVLRRGFRFCRRDTLLPLLAVSLVPFVWYFVLANHSGVHFWMTHRNLSITFTAIASAVSFSLQQNGGTNHG